MSQSIAVLDITFRAGADLSEKQYHFVKLDADGNVVACGLNEVSIGVLQNYPENGKAARVRLEGTSKLKMSEGCSTGKALTSTATGIGEVVDAVDEYAGAISLEVADGADEIIEVLITHMYSPVSHAT